jgi:hypothetical protein
MTGGLSLLTAFAITKSIIAPEQMALIFFSMAFITSAGFAINDFFDRESDAVIKPKRPIPAGALTLKQVITVSSILFAAGLIMAYFINWLSFTIIAADSLLLLLYSYLVKRKSGFLANILVGILTGTAFMYGQATVLNEITYASLSLYPIAFGTIGGNVSTRHTKLGRRLKSRLPNIAPKSRQCQRSQSRRILLYANWSSCTIAIHLRRIHSLLSAIDFDVESSINLLFHTSCHFCIYH